MWGFFKVVIFGGTVPALLCLVATGCSDDSGPEPPPPERVTHHEVSGRAPRASGGFPSVVMLEPEGGTTAAPEVDDVLLIDQYNTDFHPRLLIARPGQPVEFKNSENVLHNIHVTDPSNWTTVFNVATPTSGAYAHKFDREGAFDVACDIHPAMAAYIVVTRSLYAVITETDGSFSFPDVPNGSHRVEVWNLDPSRRVERVVRVDGAVTELVLEP